MNFPCPNRTDCTPVADDPLRANISAEEPDRLTYFSLYWPFFGQPGFPSNPGPGPGPGFCEVITSQAQADLCAQTGTVPPPGLPRIFGNTVQSCTVDCIGSGSVTFSTPANLFFNTTQEASNALAREYACLTAQILCGTPRFQSAEQTCNFDCGGSTESYTVAAGAFSGSSQAEADAAALAFACTVASMLCGGGGPPIIFSSTPQTCTVTCPNGGTVSYTAPANTALALTQAEADAGALAFACALANLMCSNVPPLAVNTAQTCTITCNGSPLSYTVPAGAFFGIDVNGANLSAFTFACQVVNEACVTQIPPPPMTVPNTVQSCTQPCPDGGTFTAAIASGQFWLQNQAASDAAAQSYACNIAVAQRTCLGPLGTTRFCQNSSVAQSIAVSGLVPTGFVVIGTLPPGVGFANGVFSGTGTTIGSYTFTIRVFNAYGYGERSYTIIIAGITTTTLADATQGAAYLQSVQASGFTLPTISVVGGALPTGLSMNTDGVISGTPTASGPFNFIVQAQGDGISCQKMLSITVAASSDCPDWDTELMWGTASSVGENPPSATFIFSPQNAANDTWATVGGTAAFPPLNSMVWGNIGEMTYNGTGCNCNLHLETSYGFTDPTEVTLSLIIEDITDLSTLLLVPTQDGNDAGNYDFPFSLPNTFGADHLIRVTVSFTAANVISGGAANVSALGTISNV